MTILVDCGYSNWGDWEECDRQCGGGSQSRRRNIVTEAGYGGIQCTDDDTVEYQSCNQQLCQGNYKARIVIGGISREKVSHYRNCSFFSQMQHLLRKHSSIVTKKNTRRMDIAMLKKQRLPVKRMTYAVKFMIRIVIMLAHFTCVPLIHQSMDRCRLVFT